MRQRLRMEQRIETYNHQGREEGTAGSPVLAVDDQMSVPKPTAPQVPVQVLERMTDAFFALDAAWRFTYLNAAAERLLERSREDLLGRAVWDAFPEAIGPVFQQHYEQARASGEMVSFVAFYPPLDRWFAVRVYPGVDADGDADTLTVYFQDVTVERTERERLRWQATLLEQAHDAMFVWELGGPIVYWNRGSELLYGFAREEAIGRISHDLLRTLLPSTREAFEAELAHDGEWTGELTHTTRDGRHVVVLSRHQVVREADGRVYVLETSRDVTERLQLEGELAESEQRFRGTFENAAVGIAHVAPDGRWMDVNDRLCAILGYSREELLARAWQDITYPDDLNDDLTYTQDMLAGVIDHYAMEKRYIRKDGTLMWGQLTVALARDATGMPRYFISIVEDISTRKRAEEALRESEEKFRLLADNMPQLAWMADETGERFWYNQRWYDYTDTTWEKMRGRGWRRVHHPEHVRRMEEHIRQSREHGEPWEDTFPLRGKDGSYRWFLTRALPIRDGSGAVVRWLGTSTDIEDQRHLQDELATANTELMQAKEVAEQRAHELAVILDAMGDGVVLIGPQGDLVQTNPACLRLLDLEHAPDWRTTYLQATPTERSVLTRILDGSGQPVPEEAFPSQRLLRGETFTGAQALELRIIGRAGHERVVRVSGVPLRDARGQPQGGVVVMHDITDRVEREEDRAHMLDMVAHELRTPLTSLKATIQINQRRAARGMVLQGDQFEPAVRDVARMERLTNDLLDTARADTGHLEVERTPTDLAALCEQVVSEQMAASGRGISLELPDGAVMATVDGGRIAQVVGNLLSNALKYSPVEASVTFQLRVEGDAAVIAVRDTGPGIPAEALSRLFERFYRAPNVQVRHGSGVGLGVGLYLCKQLVERHGGTIAVESRCDPDPDHGTTFTVRLPLAPTD